MNTRSIEENSTLKKVYNLEYDLSEFSLPKWYNELIDKTYLEINVLDTCRMLTQEILVNVAIDKAIDFLNENPFEGYFWEGQLLELLSKQDIEELKLSSKYNLINDVILKAEREVFDYEWLVLDEQQKFMSVLNEFKIKLLL